MHSYFLTKNFAKLRNFAVVASLAGALVTPIAPTSANETAKGDAAAVKREAAETLDAIKTYSAEQRDEAVQELEDFLARLDTRIEALSARIDSKASDMKADARANAEKSLKELRQARSKLGEKYESLKDSSGDAWDSVKNAFAESYENVSQSLQRAVEEF